ncbi:MAG: rhomboid family intramembrane serine protease [Xanthomonadales bacterium]|nr:rhomboid family intramembrane serine protease [Xanthomonadales bacterium]
MFVRLEERPRRQWLWATPLALMLCMGLALWLQLAEAPLRNRVLASYATLPDQLSLAQPAKLFRLTTAMFLHADWTHLLGNMLFLAIFGVATERILRGWRWSLLWLAAGALANLGAALMAENPRAPIIGASGAVSALIGAYLFLFPRANLGIMLPLGLYVQFVRVPALYLLGLWLMLQIMLTVGEQSAGVAWSAHVFGFASGVTLAWLLRPWVHRRRPNSLPWR